MLPNPAPHLKRARQKTPSSRIPSRHSARRAEPPKPLRGHDATARSGRFPDVVSVHSSSSSRGTTDCHAARRTRPTKSPSLGSSGHIGLNVAEEMSSMSDVISFEEVRQQLSRTSEGLQSVNHRTRELITERLYTRFSGSHAAARSLSMGNAHSLSSSAPSLAIGTGAWAASSGMPSSPNFGHRTTEYLPRWLRLGPLSEEVRRPAGPERPPPGQLAPLVHTSLAEVGEPIGKRDTHLTFFNRQPSVARQSSAEGGSPVVRQRMASALGTVFAQSVARNALRRVLAKEAARKLLPHVTDEPVDGPPRICIFFGAGHAGPAAEAMAVALAAAVAPLGERGLVLLAGEPSLTKAFGLAYGEAAFGVPLWSVLPNDRVSELPGSIDQEIHTGSSESECRDVFAQLGDLYLTFGSGPDVEEVASAVAARGGGLIPLAHDAAGRLGLLHQFPQRLIDRVFFTSLTAWEQLRRSGLSAGDAASLMASALDCFLRASEALRRSDAEAIEFEIDGIRYAAKVVETSALATPALPGATHLLAYFRRPEGDSRVEWVTLDEGSRLLTDTYGHEGIPYQVVAEVAEEALASLPSSLKPHKTERVSVWDVQRYMTDFHNPTKESATREHDFDPACMRVFKLCSVQGEIPTDHLAEACSQLGHWMINREWIQDLVRSKFNNVAFLDKREFFVFVSKYQDLFSACMKERFNAVDRRSVGRLGHAEVAQFLRNMGVTPVKGVVEDLMAEASNDKQRTPLDLDQFTALNRIIWMRVGFTLSEADFLMKDILARYPALASSDLSEAGFEQLALCTRWLGYPATLKHWETLPGVDLDDSPASAVPHGRDFLALMRALREQWVKTVQDAFSSTDLEDGGDPVGYGILDPRELEAFVKRVGFVAMPEAVQEAVRDCHLEGRRGFLLEDVYEVLEALRQKECMTHSEVEDSGATKYSDGGNAGLTGVPLSSALRQAGWALPVTEVQDMLLGFDLDKSDSICEVEFVKLGKKLREDLILKLDEQYEEKELHLPGKITESELRSAAMCHLPFRVDVQQVQLIWHECGSRFAERADRWDWLRLVLAYWRAVRDKRRENFGFDNQDVRNFLARFARHAGGTGVITLADKNLASLLDETFPTMRVNLKAYQKAAGWLAEVGRRRDPVIDFTEFLRMMRQLEDDADEEPLEQWTPGSRRTCPATR
ncbi:unnamed protein product [Prorocentrum cordatum]|uniref:Calmodulin n=1 Tax=Prorocentrum cordatum TaxID=2364126 RepID=A0ABN9PZP7_9DINO|nr:unnamed protein product [Polarella glacialis]